MAKRIPLTRFLVEGMVIVVSILLAFGIDAWRDRALDDELRATYLSALEEKFEAATNTDTHGFVPACESDL